ncbi:hypothetical protein ACIA8K_12665 [Catenuloplanes sp. NPDC051500]|uniref:hypothetical protein n=1 Tax=Catenuloplanes sp. NPDC051500 TaxID=3363959 RepID=UPI0037A997C2
MAYASLDELKERLDWDLDEGQERIAEAALQDASDLAMEYGREWPEDAPPRQVRVLVLRAARRFVENPQGYTTSRAGDETVQWSDAAGENAGSVYFTREEQKLLAGIAGRGVGLTSVTASAWGPQSTSRRMRKVGETISPSAYVPVNGSPNSPFPYFGDGLEPW